MRLINRIIALCLMTAFVIPGVSSSGFLLFADEPLAPSVDMQDNKISMDFDSALLQDILKIFSQQSGLNFISGEAVGQKKITIHFENVSINDALNGIFTANNLTYDQPKGSNVLIVREASNAAEVKTEIRVFHLKHTRLSSSPLDVGGQKTVSDLVTDLSSTSSSESSSESSSSDTGKGIDVVIANLLTAQGKITIDSPTNCLIVSDTPENLDQIEKVLQEIDVPVSQVIIEVYLMEVRKNILADIGMEWGGTDGALASFAAGSRTTAFPFSERFVKQNEGTKASAVVDSEGDATTSELSLGTFSLTNFRATLHFITSDTKTKILARPRVLTMNNEAASIRLTTNAAIANTTTTTGGTGGISTQTSNVAERSEIGISLRMTPQINGDKSVGLYLEPSVTTVSPSTLFPTVFLDPTTRLVRTMVRVKNHQTLVIGGLIDSSQSAVKRKMPFLGDLPGVGQAFRYDNNDGDERELLIFITPHIVESYSSLGINSATAEGRDLTIQRMLDSFSVDEVGRAFHSFDTIQETSEALKPSKTALQANSASLSMGDPKLEKEMALRLGGFETKTTKTNQ